MTDPKTKKTDAPAEADSNAAPTETDAVPAEKMLIVISKVDGFRRAGREWHGETEVPVSEFTEEQLAQLMTEPKLHVRIKD